MSELPPIFLLFDLTALLAGQTREWQEFSRVGRCFVPQAVYEEIQALGRVGVDRNQEQTAREFVRFFGESDWQLTGVGATHSSLQPVAGQIYSRRARLALTVAECAYGLSRSSPGRLVALIGNDQPLLQRIQGLSIANLCGIPLSALLIWTRSGRRPPIVAQHLQAMRSTTVTVGIMPSSTRVATATKPTRPARPPSRAVSRVSRAESLRAIRPDSHHPTALYQIVSGLSALVAAILVMGIVWYIVQPKAFNQFMRDRNLPTLPEMSTVEN
ncbi:PIN domain-containing protein [Phormidesmis sp. 146-33]